MKTSEKTPRVKLILSGTAPLIFVTLMIAYVSGPGSNMLEFGVSLPELTMEKIDFKKSEIWVTVRNTGHFPVQVTMADVNDRIQPAAIEPNKFLERYETALVRIPFEWNEAEPYVIGLTTDDGTRFEKEITAAAPALTPNLELVGFFTIIGTYVGIIPIMIGLLWLPFIKRISKSKFHFFLALTVGLLLFLGIDSVEEASDISSASLGDVFNGVLLVVTTAVLSFLGLYYASEKLTGNAGSLNLSRPIAIGLMIATGIGLHNFGEGLAIGASVGLGSAFGTFLIIGFALHNTTEGLAIAAPMSREKLVIGKLVFLGILAGSPAIFGAWLGGFAYSPFSSVIFLSIGAGAIFQVIVVILKWIQNEGDKNLSSAKVVSGFALGLLLMYLTSILI
jgi:zinc transporter ZupT